MPHPATGSRPAAEAPRHNQPQQAPNFDALNPEPPKSAANRTSLSDTLTPEEPPASEPQPVDHTAAGSPFDDTPTTEHPRITAPKPDPAQRTGAPHQPLRPPPWVRAVQASTPQGGAPQPSTPHDDTPQPSTPQQPTPPQPEPQETQAPQDNEPTWPAVPTAAPPWTPQPPPLDEPPAKRPDRTRNRTALLAGGAVLIVLVIAAVLWFTIPATNPTNQAQPRQPTSQPQPEPSGPAVVPADLSAKLPALPGIPLQANPMQPVNTVVKDGYYDNAIATGITRAGAKQLLLRESVANGNQIYLLSVIPASTPRICQATAAVINNYQRSLGLADDPAAALGANTVTLGRGDKAGSYERAAYCSGRMTVLLGAATADGQQAGALRSGFSGFGRAVVEVLPPN